MELSLRLRTIESLIDDGSIILDIGCDHAYLSIDAVNNNKALKAYALDNKIKPLENAKKNITESNLTNKVIPILSDGFKSLEVTDYDTIIIAGMGGINIIEILEEANDLMNKSLILEANRDTDKLRLYLINNGFEIIDEKIVFEDDFYYFIIKTLKTNKKTNLSQFEIDFGPILIKNKDKTLLNFIDKMLKQLKEAYKYSNNNQKLESKIKYLEEARNEIK